ncbi:MAG: GntR family transcriptional regulator [Lachnospiraceae bacterium]|nr:GntR family transcriptional regulator [Lachnospiraceae bacterium]MBR4780432.1 GntR family transcriptional regulator [Lachnospiraceae bacterium]MBR6474931.1 GntR family transcriptional regulator [Lachnospiraceae bacterium]
MISINYRDSRPVYEQIVDGFKKLIMTGLIKKDEKMPSVRELASQYAINPNTIQRAYRDLENDGYIYSVPGKGSFAVDVNEISGKHIAEIYDRLDTVLKDFDIAGESREHVADYVLNNKKSLPDFGSIEMI